MKLNQRVPAWIILVLLVTLPSCKEGDALDPGGSLATAGFQAEMRPSQVTSRYVSLRTNSIDGGRIVLDLVVTDVDLPVAGVVIKLSYPNSFSQFVGCLDGELLPPGACFSNEPGPGSGEVFVARVLQGPGQVIVGDQVALRLEFLVFDSGLGAIVIEGQNLGASDASAVLDEDLDPIPVEWFSGAIEGS